MRRLFLILKSYFPSQLPVGMTAFQKWADEVCEIVGPLADKDSMHFALASQIIHSDAKKSSVPKNHFVRCLRKSAANQVASQVFQDVKTAQAKKADEQKAAADTATQVEAVSNVSKVL